MLLSACIKKLQEIQSNFGDIVVIKRKQNDWGHVDRLFEELDIYTDANYQPKGLGTKCEIALVVSCEE